MLDLARDATLGELVDQCSDREDTLTVFLLLVGALREVSDLAKLPDAYQDVAERFVGDVDALTGLQLNKLIHPIDSQDIMAGEDDD